MEFIGAPPTVDLTYSDVFLVPRRSRVVSRLDVDLAPQDGTPATLPLVASNMNSVTGPRLAAVMARRGGLAVLPQDMSMEALTGAISWVKQQPVPVETALVFAPEQTAADALAVIPSSTHQSVIVADQGALGNDAALGRDGDLPLTEVRGVLSAARLASVSGDALLGDLITHPAVVMDAGELTSLVSGRERFAAVESALAAAADLAPSPALADDAVVVADQGLVIGTLSLQAALRSSMYSPSLDAQGRLAVAAAVGINGDPASKARTLAQAGADVLVVDTAHGHQENMIRALSEIAELDLRLPIVAGNVVTGEGAEDLITAGASIVKVGVGPGAMCTTRMMTAVGRPQFSAVREAAEVARAHGAHVWADGGVKYPRDVALAIAAGGASVMIGSWFAGTAESPGPLLRDADGRIYKESWGMASTRAVQGRFGALGSYERARKELFAEGISSSKIYLDPQRPGVEDLLDMITSGVRSSFTYAGAGSLPEFQDRARVGLQSAAGYEEGKALPVSW